MEMAALGGIFASRRWTCLFQGEKKIKRETETKRECAINITQTAKCRAKEALTGVGTQMEEGKAW